MACKRDPSGQVACTESRVGALRDRCVRFPGPAIAGLLTQSPRLRVGQNVVRALVLEHRRSRLSCLVPPAHSDAAAHMIAGRCATVPPPTPPHWSPRVSERWRSPFTRTTAGAPPLPSPDLAACIVLVARRARVLCCRSPPLEYGCLPPSSSCSRRLGRTTPQADARYQLTASIQLVVAR